MLLLVRYQRRDSSCSSKYHSAATAPASVTVLAVTAHKRFITDRQYYYCYRRPVPEVLQFRYCFINCYSVCCLYQGQAPIISAVRTTHVWTYRTMLLQLQRSSIPSVVIQSIDQSLLMSLQQHHLLLIVRASIHHL